MPYNTEKYTNDAQTTLASGIPNATANFIRVNSRTPFPGNPRFRIRIEDELLVVESGANTTEWIVTRGSENTGAVSHASGTTITHILTADSLNQIRKDMVSVDNFVSQATGDVGTLFFPHSGNYLQRYNGINWEGWGPLTKFEPPNMSGFRWVNRGDASGINQYGGITLFSTGTSPIDEVRMLVQNTPTGAYQLIAKFIPLFNNYGANNGQHVGISVRDSGTQRFTTVMIHVDTTTTAYLGGSDYNNPQSFNVAPFLSSYLYVNIAGPCIVFKFVDDMINHKFYHSCDGVNFTKNWQRNRTSFLANPNEIGFNINPYGANDLIANNMLSWEVKDI